MENFESKCVDIICKDCKNQCKYSLKQIKSLKMKDLMAEIKLHFHDTHNFKKKKKSSTMKEELHVHYTNNHNKI